MTIHHATLKKAERAEITLRDISTDEYRRFSAMWKDMVFVATDVQEALSAALMAKMLKLEHNVVFVQRFKAKEPVGYEIKGLGKYDSLPNYSEIVDAYAAKNSKAAAAEVTIVPDDEEIEEDDSAEPVRGTVVKDTYKALYAERGNPRHCGDWLAGVLENQFNRIHDGRREAKFDRDLFLDMLELNDINTNAKWAMSTTPGWQGRLRMTGRLQLENLIIKTGKIMLSKNQTVTAPEDFVKHLIARRMRSSRNP